MGKYSKKKKKTAKTASSYANHMKQRRKKKALLTVLTVLLVLLLASIGGMYLVFSGFFDDQLILPNVSAAGIDLSGKTREEATTALQSLSEELSGRELVVELPDATLTLAPADTQLGLDVAAAVETAYAYGRSGTWSENRSIRENASNTALEIPLADCLLLNEAFITGQIEEYCSGYNSDFAQSTLSVEGDAPVLDSAEKNFNAEAPCQTVVLYMGIPGRYVDPDAVYEQVLQSCLDGTFQTTVAPSEEETLPDKLEDAVQELYDELHRDALNSEMDPETWEGTCEVYGYTFDLDAAFAALEEAVYGETVEIPCTYILPEVCKADLDALLFRDELASYETSHSNNSNRTNNLKLACAAIDGLVLMPGQQFDYNKALGKRTAEAGYKAADAYSAGQTVQTIGGGICQVSSTLYYCTLIADLQIDVRTAHSYVSSYMPLGMDATVSWGGPEFRFSNNTNYPIRIEAEVEGGYVKVKLIGTDEKDYYVKMEYETLSTENATTVKKEYTKDNAEGYKDGQVIQTAYNGCTVQTYKCKYSKETDELLSREKEALSKYKKRDKIVVTIVTEPTPEATEAPASEDAE